MRRQIVQVHRVIVGNNDAVLAAVGRMVQNQTPLNAQDANKAAGDNKQKIPADNKIPYQGDQQKWGGETIATPEPFSPRGV